MDSVYTSAKLSLVFTRADLTAGGGIDLQEQPTGLTEGTLPKNPPFWVGKIICY
jgi:hypothetical protein